MRTMIINRVIKVTTLCPAQTLSHWTGCVRLSLLLDASHTRSAQHTHNLRPQQLLHKDAVSNTADKKLIRYLISVPIYSSRLGHFLQEEAGRSEFSVCEQTELLYCNTEATDGSLEQGSLAGPLHISYPIKDPPAHAFQLQSEIYCPGAALIQQDTEGRDAERDGNKCAWEVGADAVAAHKSASNEEDAISYRNWAQTWWGGTESHIKNTWYTVIFMYFSHW